MTMVWVTVLYSVVEPKFTWVLKIQAAPVLAVSPAPPSIAVLPSAEIETQPPWAAAKSPSVAARFEPS